MERWAIQPRYEAQVSKVTPLTLGLMSLDPEWFTLTGVHHTRCKVSTGPIPAVATPAQKCNVELELALCLHLLPFLVMAQ